MALKQTKNIWFNNKLVHWEDATIHVLTYALHYGSAVFKALEHTKQMMAVRYLDSMNILKDL